MWSLVSITIFLYPSVVLFCNGQIAGAGDIASFWNPNPSLVNGMDDETGTNVVLMALDNFDEPFAMQADDQPEMLGEPSNPVDTDTAPTPRTLRMFNSLTPLLPNGPATDDVTANHFFMDFGRPWISNPSAVNLFNSQQQKPVPVADAVTKEEANPETQDFEDDGQWKDDTMLSIDESTG